MAKRKKSRQQLEHEEFHATVVSLLRVPHNDWTEWEYEWLLAEARRSENYAYTEREWDKLKQLVGCSKTVEGYAGYSVEELLKMALPYRFDIDEDAQEFIERLHGWNATDLKIWQARRLYLICRQIEALEEAA